MRVLYLTACVLGLALTGCTEGRLSDSALRAKLASQQEKTDSFLAETQSADADDGAVASDDLGQTDDDLGATDDDALAQDADVEADGAEDDADVETSTDMTDTEPDVPATPDTTDTGPDVPATPDTTDTEEPDVPATPDTTDTEPDVPATPDTTDAGPDTQEPDVPTCNATQCNDGNPCTVDGCAPTGCTHTLDATAAKCDDGNPCTADGCTPTGCSHLPDNATKCSDANPCTDNFCAGGLCKSKPVDCDDMVDCTLDTCDPVAAACTHTASNAACDDGKVCTTDACDKDAGCAHVPVVGPCDDGDACTVQEACVALACVGAIAVCDDGNPCTSDACNAATGCTYLPVAGGTACNGSAQCDSVGGCGPADMVYVPAGDFWMGCNATVDAVCAACPNYSVYCNQYVSGESPQHKVTLSPYFMDRYENTNAKYKTCIDAGKCAPKDTCGLNGTPDSSAASLPTTCVTADQADVYCKTMIPGGRLPTEAEWERAARGGCEKYIGKDCQTAMPKYPWGNVEPTCDLANISGCSTGLWPPGKKPAGASPYGIYDMAGNVREWVADKYSQYPASAVTNPTGGTGGYAKDAHVYRGGNWHNDGAVVARASSRRANVDSAEYTNGFRCVRTAQ